MEVRKRFFFAFFNSKKFRDHVEEVSEGTGFLAGAVGVRRRQARRAHVASFVVSILGASAVFARLVSLEVSDFDWNVVVILLVRVF